MYPQVTVFPVLTVFKLNLNKQWDIKNTKDRVIPDVIKMVPVFPLFSTEGKHWLFLKNKLINKIPTLRALWKIDSCQISAMVKYIYIVKTMLLFTFQR